MMKMPRIEDLSLARWTLRGPCREYDFAMDGSQETVEQACADDFAAHPECERYIIVEVAAECWYVWRVFASESGGFQVGYTDV